MPKTVGIVLVNYQDYAARFLAACRDSLRAQSYPAASSKIYIIDNAATAESAEFLRANYPEALILSRLDGNYAAANNLGFRQAIADGCEYLVTLNMDTEVAPDWLVELVRALDENPTAGLAQSKIMLYPKDGDKSQARLNSLGNLIHFLGFGFTSAYGEADREIAGYPEIKGYASGCSFAVRADVYQQVGGYEEEFYMYHDDLELSLKIRLAGYRIILAPRSVVYHKYEFGRSTRMLYHMERNRQLMMFIFFPLRLWLLVALPALAMELALLLYAALGGWLPAKLRAYGYFFRAASRAKIKSARRRVRQLSVAPFSGLAADFRGRIEFQEIANPILKYLANPLMNLYWALAKKLI